MKALIVDDSRAMRMILSKILKEIGFETAEAGHGREALDRMKALPCPPELILVDWNMPEMNGIELVHALRADSVYDDSRIMMVTTETELAHVAQALQAGANEYMMKPFTKDSVIDKLRIMGMA
jgi:two-component system, chemotaxis family, chemotaxis protein CheY